MASLETTERETDQGNRLPNVNWKSLNPLQARFTYALLGYVPSEYVRASDHVYSSRYRLQTISDLAKRLTNWSELWDSLDYEDFQMRIEQGLYEIEDGIERDDLLGSSFSVLELEATCYKALGVIANGDLVGAWREGLGKDKGERSLQDWARKNKEEGLRIHPAAATGKDERIRAVRFPDGETYTDGLVILDETQRGDLLDVTLPGNNTVHVPRWFYNRWNRRLHAQRIPHSEFDPNAQVIVYEDTIPLERGIPERVENKEIPPARTADMRVYSRNLPFGLELIREGTRQEEASPERITEAYQELLTSIVEDYSIEAAEEAKRVLSSVMVQDDQEMRRMGYPLSVLSVRTINRLFDQRAEGERDIPAITIDIPNPLRLYENVRKMDDSDPGSVFGGILGFTSFNDLVLKQEHTALSGFPTIRDDKQPAFTVQTELDLSTARTASEDHGYYQTEKVFRIQDILQELGYTSFFKSFYGQNGLALIVDDIEVRIHFGYANRETDVAQIRASLEREMKRGSQNALPSYLKHELDQVRKGPRNEHVSMDLWSTERSMYGRGEYPVLKTADDFIKKLDTYRLAVQDVIGSLYAVEGAIPRNSCITWKPYFDLPEEES